MICLRYKLKVIIKKLDQTKKLIKSLLCVKVYLQLSYKNNSMKQKLTTNINL